MKRYLGLTILATTLAIGPPQPNFTVESVWLNPDALVIQHEPGSNDPRWYVWQTNNWTISGSNHIVTAYVGPCVKLAWSSESGREYNLEYSTNATWYPIRVRIIGTGLQVAWYDYSAYSRSYRLLTYPQAPSNLQVTR